MPESISRRQFLKSAGGVTFLALSPIGKGLFVASVAADAPGDSLPIFTALPYIQPGAGSRLVEGSESIAIAWQTQAKAATFEVEFGPTNSYGQRAHIHRTQRWSGDSEDGEMRFNYAAQLKGLRLGWRYLYRVRCNQTVIMEGYFTTRQPRGRAIRFVAFGDNSYGDASDRAIAYQAYRVRPDFVMNTGDNVYNNGLDNEYARYFFPVYNADVAGPHSGAPLLRSVPFYTVMANHDVHDQGPDNGPVANFDLHRDSLGYYTNMHLPLNGPAHPTRPTPLAGSRAAIDEFKSCAGARYPRMANYSFDYGDAHFACLDSNLYIDPTDTALQAWIDADLGTTDAQWKFVVYHHPAFNVGDEHYQEQHMHTLSPLFEKHGVDVVFNGHEHSYQRAQPLRFSPAASNHGADVDKKERLVSGTFHVDAKFNGRDADRPDGILHIVTGAGGKHLYDADKNSNPSSWLHPQDGNVAYVNKFVSDRYSLTVCELDGDTLYLTQVDENGETIDRIRVQKFK